MVFTLGAHDWPEFRGPTGQGLSPAKDVPIRWSATENVAWKMAIPGSGWSSPVLVPACRYRTTAKFTEGGRKELISPGAGGTYAYDPATGRELWKVSTGAGFSVVPRPVFAHGLLFVNRDYDFPKLFAIRPGGEGDVTSTHLAWQTGRGAPSTPPALVVGEELYFVSDAGIATCTDAKTGKVHSNERLGGGFSASPVFADGRFCFQNEESMGYVLKAGKTFEQLPKNELGERTMASYAVGDGALFILSEDHLFRIGKK